MKPLASWHLQSPVVFTASAPHAADGKAGVGTILHIFGDGSRPDWIAENDRMGIVYQAEGETQAQEALTRIQRDGGGIDRAVVTTLGIDPAPFVALGVTSCMVECYAQDDLVHTSIPRMRYAATVETEHEFGMGWPHVIPILGVYGDGKTEPTADLNHYIHFAGGGPDIPGNGGPAAFKGGHWRGGPLGVYLAEGMTDTGSWTTLAGL